MKLSAILADRRTLEIPFDEDVLTITYWPSAVTPRNISVALDQDDNNQSQAVVELLTSILEDWDLTDDSGVHVAISAEMLETLPVRFLSDILVAITSDTNTDPTNSGSSAAPLSRKARSVRSRNGTR